MANGLLGIGKDVPGEGQGSRQRDDAEKHGSHSHIAPRPGQRQRSPTSAGVATSGANRVFETRAEFNFIRFIRRLRWQDSELA
jgi:hypothetical protein